MSAAVWTLCLVTRIPLRYLVRSDLAPSCVLHCVRKWENLSVIGLLVVVATTVLPLLTLECDATATRALLPNPDTYTGYSVTPGSGACGLPRGTEVRRV